MNSLCQRESLGKADGKKKKAMEKERRSKVFGNVEKVETYNIFTLRPFPAKFRRRLGASTMVH
jgi:hypothetical protein